MDPRQVFAGFLTFCMFGMLANMIKHDHFDQSFQNGANPPVRMMKMEKKSPWLKGGPELKTCWTKPAAKAMQSNGYVTFTLTSGPEYHVSQVADAVVVARYLGATLVLPDIRGSELGQKRSFQDIYDVHKFMHSLDGVIKIIKALPADVAGQKPALVRIPNRPSEEYMAKNIKPVFKSNMHLRLAIFFPSVNMRVKDKQNVELDSAACSAMFGSLELKPGIRDVAENMVKKLRKLNKEGRFVAIDLRANILEKKTCKDSGIRGMKTCYSSQEVRDFMKNVGFKGDTVIYVTQTWWHDSLNLLKEAFPNTYTKDDIIPADKKGNFLKSGELEKALDFHVCSHSNVFVPATSGMFYGNVAGKRIASGRTQIIVPRKGYNSSSSAADYVSYYVSKKKHLAYACYC